METLIIALLIAHTVFLTIWIFKLKKNINESAILEHELIYESEHDALTGLANGTLLLDRLNQSIKNARRYKKKIAVLYLGLDNFKTTNDTYGTAVCDEVLHSFSQKLLEVIRHSDTVSRIGGDEFILILDHFDNTTFIRAVIDKIMSLSKETFLIDGNKINITFSMGISLYPDDSSDPKMILHHASTAMHTVKNSGRDGYKFYIQELENQVLKREELEHALVNSLEKNQMEVYYQFIIGSDDTSIIGMEALLRWKHPAMGMLAPEHFIPLAEEIGFISDLEEWVMNTSILQFEKWHSQGLDTGVLSINLSIKRLKKEGFIQSIGELINKNPQLQEYLVFELSENQIMQESEEHINNLEKLSHFNIKLSLDHFGVGCSSLAKINKLYLYEIKIDPSIVQTSLNNSELIGTIISLAQNFNLKITAVGVESKEQLKLLKDLNCTRIQGDIYHKASPAPAIERILQERATK